MKIRQEQDEEHLIDKHIDTSWGRADARVKRAGVSVWSLIGYLRAFAGNSERVREAFALSPEELAAALAYYEQDKSFIEARLRLNNA